MTNSDNCPIFISSTLKVTASEDIDINKDLIDNENNLPIEELLQKQNAKEE
jgi:hypothetical protein